MKMHKGSEKKGEEVRQKKERTHQSTPLKESQNY